jgi:hypothetical protein
MKGFTDSVQEWAMTYGGTWTNVDDSSGNWCDLKRYFGDIKAAISVGIAAENAQFKLDWDALKKTFDGDLA